MPNDARDAVQRQLADMREAYGAWLRLELEFLAERARSTDATARSSVAWADVRDRLHKIAGGAGTFGFAAIGDECRQCEQALDRYLAGDSEAVADDTIRALIGLPQRMAGPAAAEPDTQAVADLPEQPEGSGPPDEFPLVYILENRTDIGLEIIQILESFNYRTRLFEDSARLRATCATARPDALIIDLHFEDDGAAAARGLDVAEAIQQKLETPLPLFATEPSIDFDMQLRAVRAGVSGFISRPIEPIRLAGMLETNLRRRQQRMRVLMVDDDRQMLDFHRLILESAGFAVQTLTHASETLVALESFNPDVLVLDVRMPDCSGPELAQIVRFDSRWLQMPIVYLSAVEDAGEQLEAMTRAGDDFMVKPIAPETLVSSVLARARRARELAAALSRDSLTGLLKHADIKERLATTIAGARRSRQPLSVVMIDIDYFKRVNDTYGHLIGDEVIRALSNLLRRRLRASDLLGRFGGEEFLAVLPDCNAAQAVSLMESLREAFGQFQFRAQAAQFVCSFSAGVAEYRHNQDVDALIGAADTRLYAAKKAGRNQVVGEAEQPTSSGAG